MQPISREEIEKIFKKLQTIALNKHSADLKLDEFSEDFHFMVELVNYIAISLKEINTLAGNLSNGKLNEAGLSKTNYLSGEFKELHAKLRHLSWQLKQIQDGNYNQRLEYFGDLSESINDMVAQLDAREAELKLQIQKTEIVSDDFKKLLSTMKMVIDNVNEKVYIVDPDTDTFIYMNKAAELHLAPEERCDIHARNCNLFQHIKNTKSCSSFLPAEYYCENTGAWYKITTSPLRWTGEKQVVLYIEKDITNSKEKESLEQIAFFDTATGAYNRRHAIITLNELFNKKESFAICFFDLDGLKQVNDLFGHATGDEYIMTVYKTILKSLRKEDVICRFGGDEFIAIMQHATHAVVERVITKINNVLVKLSKKPQQYKYSVSVGVVVADYEKYQTVGQLLEEADRRMYENKKSKRINRS